MVSTKNSWTYVIYFHVISTTCLKQPLKKKTKIGVQERLSLNAGQKYCRMLPLEHSAILSTFIKLPFVIKIFVLSIFEWPLKTGFTVPKIHGLMSFFFRSRRERMCPKMPLDPSSEEYTWQSKIWTIYRHEKWRDLKEKVQTIIKVTAPKSRKKQKILILDIFKA